MTTTIDKQASLRNQRRLFLWAAGMLLALGPLLLPTARTSASGIDASSRDPEAIMDAVANRPSAARSVSRVKMTIKDGSGTRERIMRSHGKRYDDANKQLTMLEAPAEMRNTAFLSVDYKVASQEDEQWLYLPNLHRVTRIPSRGRSEAFLGSDFSYSDLKRSDASNYLLKLLDEAAVVDGEACWHIEATPKNAHVVEETGYTKTNLWVSKSRFLPLQIKAWLARADRTKFIKIADAQKVGGVWTPYVVRARTLANGKVESETTLQTLSIDFGAEQVSDADFTTRRLEQGL